MISNPDQLLEIKGSDDYQFPGFFSTPYSQCLGYCPDITKLGLYTSESPDFLYYDIQLGKDKPRNPQRLTVMLPDIEETLNVTYRLIPCRGVKHCSEHEQTGCFVTSTRESKPCPHHPSAALVSSGPCPVEFVYIRPCELFDDCRWLTGFDSADSATIAWFLLNQLIAPPAIKNRFPVVECQSSGSPAQSESEYPTSVPFCLRTFGTSVPHMLFLSRTGDPFHCCQVRLTWSRVEF